MYGGVMGSSMNTNRGSISNPAPYPRRLKPSTKTEKKPQQRQPNSNIQAISARSTSTTYPFLTTTARFLLIVFSCDLRLHAHSFHQVVFHHAASITTPAFHLFYQIVFTFSASSFALLFSNLFLNHSSRAASIFSGVACAIIHRFIACLSCRHIHVADTVFPRAQSANTISHQP